MTAKTKALSESLNFIDTTPRKLKNQSLSTNSKERIFYGTYQQVVDALDAQGVPEHKVIGFQFSGTGTCIALVHIH
jgi:hypothetical protein